MQIISGFVGVLSMFRLCLIVIDSHNSLASPEDSRIWKETRFQTGSLWNSQECCAMAATEFYLRFKGSQDTSFFRIKQSKNTLCVIYNKNNYHSNCTYR